MRRKPSGGGYNNNQHRRPQRYQQGGGEQRSQGGYQHGRPRRNYGAAREKYLSQARDALASGDRVAAEYWFQHADHCYRMMVEEGQFQPRPQQNPQQQQPMDDGATVASETDGNADSADGSDGFAPPNTNALPAFITATPMQPAPVDPATIQNWEERDAEA
jgi:hypothetical protein